MNSSVSAGRKWWSGWWWRQRRDSGGEFRFWGSGGVVGLTSWGAEWERWVCCPARWGWTSSSLPAAGSPSARPTPTGARRRRRPCLVSVFSWWVEVEGGGVGGSGGFTTDTRPQSHEHRESTRSFMHVCDIPKVSSNGWTRDKHRAALSCSAAEDVQVQKNQQQQGNHWHLETCLRTKCLDFVWREAWCTTGFVLKLGLAWKANAQLLITKNLLLYWDFSLRLGIVLL